MSMSKPSASGPYDQKRGVALIGDLHGDPASLVGALESIKTKSGKPLVTFPEAIISGSKSCPANKQARLFSTQELNNLVWNGEKAVLLLLGDIVDNARPSMHPDQTADTMGLSGCGTASTQPLLFEILLAVQRAAIAKGGKVVIVIGNHDYENCRPEDVSISSYCSKYAPAANDWGGDGENKDGPNQGRAFETEQHDSGRDPQRRVASTMRHRTSPSTDIDDEDDGEEWIEESDPHSLARATHHDTVGHVSSDDERYNEGVEQSDDFNVESDTTGYTLRRPVYGNGRQAEKVVSAAPGPGHVASAGVVASCNVSGGFSEAHAVQMRRMYAKFPTCAVATLAGRGSKAKPGTGGTATGTTLVFGVAMHGFLHTDVFVNLGVPAPAKMPTSAKGVNTMFTKVNKVYNDAIAPETINADRCDLYTLVDNAGYSAPSMCRSTEQESAVIPPEMNISAVYKGHDISASAIGVGGGSGGGTVVRLDSGSSRAFQSTPNVTRAAAFGGVFGGTITDPIIFHANTGAATITPPIL
jgi:hypothetical protein